MSIGVLCRMAAIQCSFVRNFVSVSVSVSHPPLRIGSCCEERDCFVFVSDYS